MAFEKTGLKLLALLLLLFAAAFAAPVANAGADQTASVSQNLTFNGASSTCGSCTIASYTWNFGDNETATGVSATHSYSSAAIYTVTLTVVSNSSEASSDTLSVTVQSGDVTPPTINHTNVTAWSKNNSVPISATVTDSVGVSSVLLYYRNSSGTSFSSTTMSSSGNTYTASIPSSATAGANVSYYITATDSSSNSANYPTGGSSAPVVVNLSDTDTIAPITALISISSDTSSPYWVTTSNSTTGNAQVIASGETGMSCRMGQSNSNYSGMTVGYVDCTISGSQANCSETLGDGNYTRYVACKDSSSNEQNTSQTLNVTFGVDSVAPANITTVNATEYLGGITLSWTATTDATSGVAAQKIYRSASCGSNFSSISSQSASASSYNDTSGTSGTSYCYRIHGLDNAGNLRSTSGTSSTLVSGAPAITAISLTLASGTLTLSATTNENATCRYSTTSQGYSAMSSDFTTGQNTTSHSSAMADTSGTVTYYVSCADTLGNAMTGANSTSYTFAAATTATTTASSSSTGGGSRSGAAPYVPSGADSNLQVHSVNSATLNSGRTLSYSASSGSTTFTLRLSNPGSSSTGPIVVREKIPASVASKADELTFSLAPTRFETGSIIAVWELKDGIGAGQSLDITYSVAKQITTQTGIETAVASLAAETPKTTTPQPQTPPATKPTQTPAPEKQPAKPAPSAPPVAQPSAPQAPPAVPAAQKGFDFSGIVFLIVVLAIIGIAVGAYLLLGKKKKGL